MKQVITSNYVHKELKIFAAEQGITMSVAIGVLLQKWRKLEAALQVPDTGVTIENQPADSFGAQPPEVNSEEPDSRLRSEAPN